MDNSCTITNIVPITTVQDYGTNIPSVCTNFAHTISTNFVSSFLQNIITRFQERDVIIVYTIVIVVSLLLFLSYIPGIYSQWFLSLQQPRVNIWIPRIAWIIGFIVSYIGFYILARSISLNKYLAIIMLGVSGSFIFLGWSVALYQAQNIVLAASLAGILFIYQAAIFLLIWYLNPVAAIFMMPMLALYLYLVYNTVQSTELNNVVL